MKDSYSIMLWKYWISDTLCGFHIQYGVFAPHCIQERYRCLVPENDYMIEVEGEAV